MFTKEEVKHFIVNDLPLLRKELAIELIRNYEFQLLKTLKTLMHQAKQLFPTLRLTLDQLQFYFLFPIHIFEKNELEDILKPK